MLPKANRSPLLAKLTTWAADCPQRVGFRELADLRQPREVTYGELAAQVEATAEQIRSLARPGQRVALSMLSGIDFAVAFLGCLAAETVAVPLQPQPGGLPDASLPEHPLVRDSGAVAAACPDGIVGLPRPAGPDPAADPAAGIALLQYSSGSTGSPKGVIVTHDNLAHNAAVITGAMSITGSDRGLIWLPPFHDMGLVGGILVPLWSGTPVTLMSPLAFVREPLAWLRAISAERATISGGPNFAYDACVQRSTPEQRAALDLSCWEVAFAGAEPVRAQTLRRFADAFAAAGFRPQAFYPCYGLAESTLIVTGGRRGAGASAARPPAGTGAGAPPLVGLGASLPGGEIAIAAPSGSSADTAHAAGVPDGTAGEILVRSPSVTRGYWRNPTATAATFGPDGWLRTGDIGYLADGVLYICGRAKDMVVIHGRNVFPEDAEGAVAAAHPLLAGCSVAAFGTEDTHDSGTERLTILVELAVRGLDGVSLSELARCARTAVARACGVQPGVVVLVRRGKLPRTTSGKIRRHAAKDRYLSGELDALAEDRLPVSPAGDGARPTAGDGGPQPRDEAGFAQFLTAWLRDWCAQALGVPADGIPADESLVGVGLDSLSLGQLQADLSARLGVTVTLAELFGADSIAALARECASDPTAHQDRPAAPGAEVEPLPAGVTHPLGPTQEMFWLLQSLESATSAYNVPIIARLRGPLDVARLQRALRIVVARHDSLHSRIQEEDGRPGQLVLPPAGPADADLPVIAVADEEAAAAIVAETASQPFDLTAGPPPWRARLLRVGEHDHRLVFVAHHVICDGESLELLARELGQAYSQDGPPDSPAPSYLRWSAARRSWWAAARDSELDWWTERLAGLPELTLPADRDRPEAGPRPSASVTRILPPETCVPLAEAARRESATPFMAATALIWAALAAQGGSERFGLSMSVSGRTDTDADLFGCVVNALIIRADLTGGPRFRDLIRRARNEIADALTHQEAPIVDVAGKAFGKRTRAVAHTRVMLATQPSGAAMAMAGLDTELTPLAAGHARCDLSITVVPAAAGMAVTFEYDAARFDAGTIGTLADRFARLAAAAAADPDVPVAAVDLNSARDQRMLDAWGDGGPVPALASDSLYGIVAAQARLTPDRVAIASAHGAVSYAALIDRAERLAAGLIEAGAGLEDRVAICHDRTPTMIVAMLGILAAGCAYLPIRKTDPAERRAGMMRDAGAKLVLCDAETATWLDAWDTRVTTPEEIIAAAPASQPAVPRFVHPRQLAYVMYTSGSTGRPKGVAIAHSEVLPRMAWGQRTFSEAELSGVLAGTPLGFDISVLEIFITLSAGGTVVLAENVLELATLAERERVSTVMTVPSAMAALLDLRSWPASVRTVGLGGEPLRVPLARRVRELGIERLLNLYGTTEEGIVSLAAELPAAIDTVTVGYPLPGSRIGIVGPGGQRVPPGVPGEVVAGGVGVSRGYLGRPALTAAAFRPDPADADGGRRYYTGDRGRWTATGVEMLGRLDNQVKIRGHRVELGEIEIGLTEADGVAEAAAVLTSRDGTNTITAYVRLREESPEWDPIAFRASLRRRLPSYMVPADVVLVSQMPYTQSGKVDRNALAARGTTLTAGNQGTDGEQVPQPGTEQAVADVWAEMLGVPRVGRNDRWFDIGGDSLMAARMTRQLTDLFDVSLPVSLIYEEDRLAGFATDIEAVLRQEGKMV